MVKVLEIQHTAVVVAGDKKKTFTEEAIALVKVTHNGKEKKLRFTILPGFKTDGASIPRVFSWFLPQWDSENQTYNIGAVIHDGLYGRKGLGIFSREECDDILRGIWRESGIGRFKAGVADKCVEMFAGGEKHWGVDEENAKLFFCEIIEERS